jgi:hypothetical protein
MAACVSQFGRKILISFPSRSSTVVLVSSFVYNISKTFLLLSC